MQRTLFVLNRLLLSPCLFWFLLQLHCNARAEGNAQNILGNQERLARNYYPANYKRFRRGYGGRDSSDNDQFASFGLRSITSKDNFGSFRSSAGVGRKASPMSFSGNSFSNYGGPDAFLSSAPEDEMSRGSQIHNMNDNSGIQSLLNNEQSWSKPLSSKGRSKGGFKSFSSSFTPQPTSINFSKGNSRQPNSGSSAFSFGSNTASGVNSFQKSANKFFGSSPKSFDKNKGFFNTLDNRQNRSPFSARSPKKGSSSGDSSFPNPFAQPEEPDLNSEKEEDSLGILDSLSGQIHDMTGGNIVGPLKNMKELNGIDFAALLAQLENQQSVSIPTTKKPMRKISAEDKDKIFSGGDQRSANENFKSSPFTSFFGSTSDENQSLKALSFSKGGFKSKGKVQTASINCETPETPMNAVLRCSSFSGCRLECNAAHQTILMETRVYFTCVNNEWVSKGQQYKGIPDCEPICNPPCQNQGICLAPNVCNCADSWDGPTCEIPKAKLCPPKPPTPMNTRMFCGKTDCVARCMDGYKYDNDQDEIYFRCSDGKWILDDENSHTKAEVAEEPICRAVCDSPCQNSGICLAPNLCECSADYRGQQCQYPVSNCDAKNLKFNGGYNCTGKNMDYGCSLWCPKGVDFTFEPAERYTCDFATGEWSPIPIPKCNYQFSISETDSSQSFYNATFSHKRKGSQKAHGGSCITWSGFHYRSLKGKVFSFKSGCPYTLLQDASLGTFSINLVPPKNCFGSDCFNSLNIFLEGDQYVLQRNGDYPVLTYRDTSLAIPGQMNGLVTERVAHYVIVKMTGIGLSLKWDMENMFEAEVSSVLWNRTSGLCGRLSSIGIFSDESFNDNDEESLINFLSTCKATTVKEPCVDPPVIKNYCSNDVKQQANSFCNQLNENPKFASCKELMNTDEYISTCMWDYCNCKAAENRASCSCNSFDIYFKECLNRGGVIENGWRSEKLCPMRCKGDLEYNACMPVIPARCGQAAETTKPDFCVEACDCPAGLVLEGKENCIRPEHCPCSYRNKTYSSGDVLPNDCNTCTCVSGEWICTEVKCGARCSSIGDPHYTTFDGRKFDFMGQCAYYLVKGPDFSVEAENIACAGAVSKALNLPSSIKSQFPSCTRSITVRIPGTTVHLKQKNEVTVNGEEVNDLPVWANEIFIKKASSLFIIVSLSNGVDVWWDGQTRAYVDAPPELRGQVSGLCGTFNDNQKDDFLTPEGDNEQDPRAFANKWKTSQKCSDVALLDDAHPCDRHAQNKKLAETYCAKIKSNIFANCHLEVDPEAYYRDCLFDMCSCEADVRNCVCPILAAYGKECARTGIIVDWRSNIRECGLHCTGGQKYQICGDSCARTCYDLSTNPNCNKRCVEGCNCPEGFTLNAEEECVPISNCPCIYKAQEFKPGYEMFQTDSNGNVQVCKCENALWKCRNPTVVEETSPNFFTEPQLECQADENEIYTDCLPEEEPSCLTMHLRPEEPSDLCRPGCRCGVGYVRNPDTDKCVPYTSCPCHHGGRSYGEGQTIVEECNECTCKEGLWYCTTDPCPAICTAWGDSHFKTFDGRIFDFHGTCDYMLAKGRKSKADLFEISIQNVPCGTNGVTCAKSLTLKIGTGESQEFLEFSRNKPPPRKNMTRTIIREAGIFVFAEVADMGLELQWDHGTRAYVVLDPSWHSEKVKGLCGNYNGDEKDDFRTPSGGSGEVNAKVFGDSWRLQNYCPESTIIKDTCALHPHRKLWASEKCSTLRSSLFYPCHSEVPVEPYVERCQFDACGCNTGGDCHCMCTAIAAYAHECNIHGVYVKWRTPDFCPMQCDDSCESYEPCIQTCPPMTCDSYKETQSSLCRRDSCVEGCAKDVCPPGSVYRSFKDRDCVPVSACDRKCMEIDGHTYLEGAVLSEDDCHTCFCTKGKKICQGTPCETTYDGPVVTTGSTIEIVTVTSTTELFETPDSDDCRGGWSGWINQDHPVIYQKNSDIEFIPEWIESSDQSKGFCNHSMYEDIKCRTVGNHHPPSKGVSCNLREGLRCEHSSKNSKGSPTCDDYEISVLCNCGTYRNISDFTTTVPSLKVDLSSSTVPPQPCEFDGWTEWFNFHSPTTLGEFESVDKVREARNVCQGGVIEDVECTPADGTRKDSSMRCSKKGAFCRNNGGIQYCKDYKVRLLCRCQCQDWLGMSDGTIPSRAISASSATSETFGRLNSNSEWIPDYTDGRDITQEWIQVDLGKHLKVTGVTTQGHSSVIAYVTNFTVRVSSNGEMWNELTDPVTEITKYFSGNTNSFDSKYNAFPTPVVARYIRLVPIEYHLIPSLRLEITGCRERVKLTTVAPLLQEDCQDGWTTWMNSNTPSPYDWNDFENYNQLRQYFAFCEESFIEKIECRLAGLHTSIKEGGQIDVACNKNVGLQCIDEIQKEHCFDYEVRFYCQCSQDVSTVPYTLTTIQPLPLITPEPCDTNIPAVKHQTSCKHFFECQDLENGTQLVLKECNSGTLFHPELLICDWPSSVMAVRPNCEDTVIEIGTSSPQDCIDDYWSDWFNISHPIKTTGDFELIADIKRAGYDICPVLLIKDIECRFYPREKETPKSFSKGRPTNPDRLTSDMVDYSLSGDIGVTCDRREGLTCRNALQRGNTCHDYALRVLCSCDVTSTLSSITTSYLETTTSVVNYTDVRTSVPVVTDIMFGDDACPGGKHFYKYAIRCSRVCLFYRTLLVENGLCLDEDESAPACIDDVTGVACPDGYFLRDKTSCVKIFDCNCALPNGMSAPPERQYLVANCEICKCSNNELKCDNSMCYDRPKEFGCDEWSPWMSASAPSGKGDIETLDILRKYHPDVCEEPEEIECREKSSGLPHYMTEQKVVCSTKLGFQCLSKFNPEGCKDYEVRVFCKCFINVTTRIPDKQTGVSTLPTLSTIDSSTEVPTIPSLPLIKIRCNDWSPWLNMKRTPEGDFQRIADLRARYEELCEVPANISCRDSIAKLPASELDQVITCSPTEGFECYNKNNRKDCYDYEVSVFCECDEDYTTTTDEKPPVTPTIPVVVSELAPCDAFSPWINEHTPWLEDGDTEFKSLEQLRETFSFCLEGHISSIECMEASLGMDISVNKKVRCDKVYGLRCLNKNQPSGFCYDFKIRYFCTCGPSPVTRPAIITPGPTIQPAICSKDKYVDLLKYIKDSSFSGTSSLNPSFGPSSSRLNTNHSNGGAWMPKKSNKDQFLQIDLGDIKNIFGVKVAGSARLEDRVTSFSVQTSDDEILWSPVADELFRGARKKTEKVTIFFKGPIQARYVRFLPNTWIGSIALRVEIIGCLFEIPIPSTTTSKPIICDEPMGLEDGSFSDSLISVSSVLNDMTSFYGSQNARLNNIAISGATAGAWVAKPSKEEFIRFDFLEKRRVSGLVTQGRPGKEEFVETFQVWYSPDGVIWTSLLDTATGKPKIFSANFDASTPVYNGFDRIIEVQCLEIRPLTWNKNVALRVEIKGCFIPYPSLPSTTLPSTTTVKIPPPDCSACPHLPPEFHDECFTCPQNLLFDGLKCVPDVLCPCYYNGLKYEFGANFETNTCEKCFCEGSGNIKCKQMECDPCIDKNEKAVLTSSCACICKPCPKNTRLCPTSNYCLDNEKWCDGIEHCPDDELNCPAVSPSDCKVPYCPEDWVLVLEDEAHETDCAVYRCQAPEITTSLPCPVPLCPFGYNIVLVPRRPHELCPRYDCEAPKPSPTPFTCPPATCNDGYEIEMIPNDYSQQSFDDTFDYLLQENYDECPQYKCVTKEPPIAPCPMPKCPDGYDVTYTESKDILDLCPVYECRAVITTTVCPPVECPNGLQVLTVQTTEEKCTKFTCVRITTASPLTTVASTDIPCAEVVLPVCDSSEEVYHVNPTERCPEFKCKLKGAETSTKSPKILGPPTCRIKDREFSTFDLTELKIETCHHILARDKLKKQWQISIHENCSEASCQKYLKIEEDSNVLTIWQNLKIEWNDMTYSTPQAQRIGHSKKAFSLSKIGDAFSYYSSTYKFNVLITVDFLIKIKVTSGDIYQVDGLCGLFSRSSVDDRTMPDGTLASSTKQFADSWTIPDEGQCLVAFKKCSVEENKKAFLLCNALESRPFTECHDILPVTTYLKGCVDRLCVCLKANRTEEECKCGVLASYVTTCLELKPYAKVADWRIATKCYKECSAGEVYSDCFQASCERSCENMKTTEDCSRTDQDTCISGCFCEPGLIRKEGKCVLPESCRDCVCEGYGDSHLKSFDSNGFSLGSNCSYVAVRDRAPTGEHLFQVYVGNDACPGNPSLLCADSLKILYNNREIMIEYDSSSDAIMVSIDDAEILKFPFKSQWIAIEKPDNGRVAAVIPDAQLEVNYIKENFGFIIKLPSHLYYEKLEGLCGNCNYASTDDFKTPEGKVVEASDKFSFSWAVESQSHDSCKPTVKNDSHCLHTFGEDDICLKLLDSSIFGMCHPLEDPKPYVSSCQSDLCNANVSIHLACYSIEAYVRRCAQLGICLNWQINQICPVHCPNGMEYNSCGPGCVRSCENYESFHHNDDQYCIVSRLDGCYCPFGTVLHKGVCVNESQCITCDEEGHRVGDTWKTDECTTCECYEGGVATCKSKSCPAPLICEEYFELEEIPGSEDQCCGPQYVCKIKHPENCTELVEPSQSCGFGKQYKLIETPGVCSEYICVCLDAHNCPRIEKPAESELKPGEKWEVDDGGCCPQYVAKCSGKCPVPQCTEKYFDPTILAIQEGQCCPEYTCDPPNDACIYQPQMVVENGFEKPIEFDGQLGKALYRVGEEWTDGFCIECKCHAVTSVAVKGERSTKSLKGRGTTPSKPPTAKCLHRSCPNIVDHEDKDDYVLEAVVIPDSCCPKIVRTACISDGEIFKANDTMNDPLNACRSIECKAKNEANGLEKVEQIYSCDETCKLGYRYVPNPSYPLICCGECQAFSCVYEGKLKEPGKIWHSDDKCTVYECIKNKLGEVQMFSKEVHCLIPTDDELKLYRFEKSKQDDECCIEYTKQACRINDQSLQVGEKQIDPQDKCIRIHCEQTEKGEVIRREKEIACNLNCPIGHIYVPAPQESEECCGRCLQTQCVDSDKVYNIGETWENPNEKCYQYTCRMRDEDLSVVAIKRACPYFDPECPSDQILDDETGCCKLCNVTRETKKECQPEDIDPSETVGMFVLKASTVGKCSNPYPVHGFKRCNGQCNSRTEFKSKGIESRHVPICNCCKPSKLSQISVAMNCTLGYSFKRMYDNIDSCSCQACSEGSFSQYINDQPIQDLTQFIVQDNHNDEINV